MLLRELRMAAAQYAEPEKRVADRAGYPDQIARLGAAAPDFLSCGDLANRGQGQNRRPRCADRVTSQKIDPKAILILAEALGKAAKPLRAQFRRQRRGQNIMARPRSHGREIGEVDPKQLARNQFGVILRQVVHPRDNCIGRYDPTTSRTAIDERRIIKETETSR